MAITLSQQPADYNLAYSPNIWTLGALGALEDAYILEVSTYDEVTGTSEVIATIQQPANPAGVGMFDVSKILQSYMSIAWVEDTSLVTQTPGAILTYRVRYGAVTANVPDYSGTSAVKRVLNGYENWRLMNWPSQDAFIPEPLGIDCICEVPPCEVGAQWPTESKYLHNYPLSNIPVRSDVYHTLSFFNRNGNWDIGTQWGNTEQPWAVRIKYYDPNGVEISTSIYAISEQTGLGPRTTFTDTTPGAYSDAEWIGTVGAGPLNLKAAGLWPQSTPAVWNLISQVWGNYSQIWNLAVTEAIVASYTVEVCGVDMCYWGANGAPANTNATTLLPYIGDTIFSQTFGVTDPCTGYEPITLSFLNQYGVKDYFTFDRRNTYNQSIKRNNYDQVLGSWSADTFAIDPHGRGRRTFSTAIQTRMSMATYWMSDAEAAWLEELFTSPHIQVYYNGVWEPAVITSNGYEQKTNTRSGLFQYAIDIEFANTKQVQRG